jgi:hypothetical protein
MYATEKCFIAMNHNVLSRQVILQDEMIKKRFISLQKKQNDSVIRFAQHKHCTRKPIKNGGNRHTRAAKNNWGLKLPF